jgi:MoCo/4Fe-4S cofactor protein with predicted Tat translocation signal
MTSNELASTDPTSRQAKPRYWRSLSELHQREDFQEYLNREFPVAASEFPDGVSRRKWMQLMGASFAIAGVAGCRYPVETIEPFVVRPEGRIPGESYTRATNIELADRVYNLLVTCVDGRPLKIEPNDSHPGGGGTDVYAQACVLGLYDPDRARGDQGFLIRKDAAEQRRLEIGWEPFETFAPNWIKTAASNNGGAGFAVLMPPTSSPSTLRMMGQLRKRLPKSTVCRYDGVSDGVMRDATGKAFGRPAKQVLNLEQAKVIVTLQADILGVSGSMLSNAAGFVKHRSPDPNDPEMSRLYVVEGGYTNTGAMADSRLALRPSEMPALLSELGRRVDRLAAGESHSHSDDAKAYDEIPADARLERFLDVLAHDVHEAGDKAVVVVGEHLGADAVAAGILMNQKLGSLGTLQTFVADSDDELGEVASIGQLVDKINDGEIDSLIIFAGNPVFTAPADVDFDAAIAKVEHSVYVGEYDDETGAVCQWSVPLAHPLESWGDCVDEQGNYGVCQPQILPLLGGRSVVEILALMLDESASDGARAVRRTADAIAGESLSERQWRKLLHDGFSESLKIEAETLTPTGKYQELTNASPVAISAIDPETLKNDFEVLFVPADGIYDGRFANNGWLQELPQSLTKLCWDNAAVMSPATARSLEVRHGLKINLDRGEGSVDLPVYEMPGCAPGVVTVAIGYGRLRAGMVGGMENEDAPIVGVDVSPIRASDAMLTAYQVKARPRLSDDDEYELATTQDHWAIDIRGRDETERRSFSLVREGTTELLKKVPSFANEAPKAPHVPHVGEHGSPWQEPINAIEQKNKEEHLPVPQWGMAIDLTKCIGCNACVIACQSENNVPIVGREQVMNSREMHWLRVDRYFQGDEENADIVQEPMACQHCETAPCEQVCPVAATVHTNEGINAMAYNRCIGTRYCANNCPFKVRRFNYFNYNDKVGVGYGVDAYPSHIEHASRKLQALVLNPEVTVRGRGVMEKCTYCIQRVEKAKIEAIKDGRRAIRDGDVITACQSACPTRAIDFGNIEDSESAVAKKHADPRSYKMLAQLNVKARTQYLAGVRNPHPRLMTRAQLDDLKDIHALHGGHDGDHEQADDHGGDGHDLDEASHAETPSHSE